MQTIQIVYGKMKWGKNNSNQQSSVENRSS